MAIEVLSVSDKNVNNLLFSLYALVNRRRSGQRHVAHRDLKTDNILITEKKVLIADFGFSDILPNEDTMATQRKGTVVYMSPEQFLKRPFDPFKCDMFALGVVHWCMVFKVNVLNQDTMEPMMETVRTKLSPTSIDRLILTNLLEYQPEERLSIFELIFLMEESCFSHRIAKLKAFKIHKDDTFLPS
ncbi:serine/threonine-protein kinase Nek4-like [Biomphalaria glabrata]|uniref:Serine/threonine-protein kinase Nek4-like n=1 Tax=Biomphalaria glabrata TaxID=6526 RepID=A0A9W3BI12_BIOGL|nr:serine/threonine-protein kinase Nek4-like [Biomphalaria glabrata]